MAELPINHRKQFTMYFAVKGLPERSGFTHARGAHPVAKKTASCGLNDDRGTLLNASVPWDTLELHDPVLVVTAECSTGLGVGRRHHSRWLP